LSIDIQEYPVFEKGIFKKYPALFDAYLRNVPEHQKKKYQKARKTLPEYEETYKWPVIKGPGYCGTTHPGTGKTFTGVMTGASHPVYNSDCLYINNSQNVFAISDPPGATTFSRGLITELDKLLQTESVENLEAMINEVNRNAGAGLKGMATLAIVHFPLGSSKALFLLSGDSILFHGNAVKQKIYRLEAVPNRWGTPSVYFELQKIDIIEGDFFVLASDGITAARPPGNNSKFDKVVLNLASNDADNFALNVATACNAVNEEENNGRARTFFGGGDDVSVIMIDPQKLQPADSKKSYILGGYVEGCMLTQAI
jgi:hypothetical protein